MLAVRRRCRLLPRRLHRMRGSGTFLLGGRKLLKKNATTESLQTKKHRRCGKSLVDFESALPLIRQNGEKAAGPGRGRSSGETAAGLELGRLSGETAEGPRTARLLLSRGPRAPGPPVRSLRGPMPPTPRAHLPTEPVHPPTQQPVMIRTTCLGSFRFYPCWLGRESATVGSEGLHGTLKKRPASHRFCASAR